MHKSFDIVIIGGGNAGLTLAKNLLNLGASENIAVIEPTQPSEKRANWCSWHHKENLANYQYAVRGIWDSWTLINDKKSIKHKSSDYKYACIDSALYLSSIEEKLKASNIKIIRDSVEKIKIKKNNKRKLQCTNNTYEATHVFDSRPPEIEDGSLRQHFLGIEFELHDNQNIEVPILMDFRVNQSDGLHFIYALPFSDNRLFIESTVISKKFNENNWYRRQINQWIEHRNLKVSKVISEETGAISQERYKHKNKSIEAIGARGGAIRLSSGYAFHNIQEQVRLLAKSIKSKNYSTSNIISNKIYFMDTLFNKVMINNPKLSSDLFLSTACHLKGKEFAEFMLNKADTLTWCKVIMNMPKIPFMKEITKQIIQ